MRTQLFSHNKTAYQKVMKAFETSDRTCVVHPTGTGKSFLIAAVSESFEKVLILAPNSFVINQVKTVTGWHKGIDYMTYQLLNYRGIETKYDLIVLDEFHRAGAEEWGASVTEVLNQNGGKVLGTTATPIRYLDGQRNMAEELFHGNVASQITIAEAWSRNILPIPTYITGLYDFTNTARETRQFIKLNTRLSKDEKCERLKRLSNLEMDWEQSGGMPTVLQKHLDADTHRVIIFCGGVDIMHNMKPVVIDWFKKAGLKVADIYTVDCNMTDGNKKRTMEAFEQDTDQGIKIMMGVNMLNEGIHIPRVDAVIMLRTTSSRIIYMQQLGRCLTAANTSRPVVFDMVDNITGTNIIHGIRDEYECLESKKHQTDAEREMRQFQIIDYVVSLRDVIDKLRDNPYFNSFADGVKLIKEFVEKHGRQPKKNEGYIAHVWQTIIKNPNNDPEIIELRNRYAFRQMSDSEIEEKAEEIINFIKKNNRRPLSNGGLANEATLYHRINSLKKYTYIPKVAELLELLKSCKKRSGYACRNVRRNYSESDNVKEYIAFCEKYKRLPGRGLLPREKALTSFIYRKREERLAKYPELRKTIEKYRSNDSSNQYLKR